MLMLTTCDQTKRNHNTFDVSLFHLLRNGTLKELKLFCKGVNIESVWAALRDCYINHWLWQTFPIYL